MQRARGLAGLVVALTVLDACSFLVDDSALTSREDRMPTDAGAADDGADARDANDAAADAPFSVGACGAGDFADDFEREPSFGWSPFVGGGATAVVDGVRPRHGARSLHLSKLTTTTGAQAMLHVSFAPGVSIASCSFDMYVDLVEGAGGLEVFKHSFDPAPDDPSYSDYAITSLNFAATGSSFAETIKAANYAADGVPLRVLDGASKRWFHIDTIVEPNRILVAIDGTQWQKPLLYRPSEKLRETVLIGMNYEGDGNRWEIFVDDVCCKPARAP